ncbi:SDR family NAD(P)-dependent oxidoreductase [Salinibacterium hongtaonis]|uniref:KR domain-containing protein n=1 Tax=Homoserinimonas hongtaonis TaxID=2079791 RepID=A0A2U1T008_9MICO|nr:SDR family oxidoreductase [Salinibacterium hongtaonis]AWB89756.1 beta-ketoacyl-ACP reductase [Salinibacterium hongtaonis]PWB97211.1 KR domain-containing protein [Salinibacterium hongtaonis]
MGTLTGKVAIVTGAGAPLGLGRAYALGLAAEGASLVINDVNESADAVVAEIVEAGGKAVSVLAPVGSRAAAETILQAALDAFGRADILVNNAGIVAFTPVLELQEDLWDKVFAVHVKGSAMNTSVIARWMVDNDVKGSIVNITSTAGIYGTPEGGSEYSAAKSAIVGMTKSHSRELAPHGIRVNAVAPGALTMDPAKMPPQFTELAAGMVKTSVLGRIGVADDVAPTVVFLASEKASYVTGQIIAATGNTGVA